MSKVAVLVGIMPGFLLGATLGSTVAGSTRHLSQVEMAPFVEAVRACWSAGPEAPAVRMHVTFSADARPIAPAIRLVGAEGGGSSPAAIENSFTAGKRAILRCAKTGYPLPPAKFDLWREIEIVFNPATMRVE